MAQQCEHWLLFHLAAHNSLWLQLQGLPHPHTNIHASEKHGGCASPLEAERVCCSHEWRPLSFSLRGRVDHYIGLNSVSKFKCDFGHSIFTKLVKMMSLYSLGLSTSVTAPLMERDETVLGRWHSSRECLLVKFGLKSPHPGAHNHQ